MIYVNIIGTSILSVFALFIILKKSKILSDYLLLLSIVLFSGILMTGILLEQKPSSYSYALFLFFNSFIFPSLVIYGLVLLSADQKFKLRWLWAASYAMIFIVFIGVDIFLLNDYNTGEQINMLIESPSVLYNILYKGQYIFVIVILIWLLRKFKNYQNKIKNIFSSIDTIHLNWFKNFIYIYLWINLISLMLFLMLDLGLVSTIYIPLLIEHIILVLALFYLCYHGIKQYSLAEIPASHTVNDDLLSHKATTVKYSSSSLSFEEMQDLYLKIERLFEDDKIYLESELKIDVIASKLNVTSHRISQTLNTIATKPFYDYVNAFRVTHLKRLLTSTDSRKFTILALAFESGFNSKATFNRVFKQHEGMTPKAYQKSRIIA